MESCNYLIQVGIGGGFNYRRYLNSQNIYASIFSNDVSIFELPKFDLIYKIKKSIEKKFLSLLPREYVGILEGMIIGDTSYISDEISNDFRNCGITHLLAVSGSNVAYVLVLCKFLFEKLFGRNISSALSIIFIIIFTVLSGGSASVVRATIMAAIIIISEFLSRKPNVYASISFSALIILLYNPLIIYDIGFILSFGGTIGIVVLSKKINQILNSKLKIEESSIENFWVETLSVTLAAQIAVTPITLYFFNTFSTVSIIVNLIIVPITGFVTILGIVMYFCSLFFTPLAVVLSYVLYALIGFMIIISKLFSSIGFSNLLLPTPSILLILTYYLIVCMYFYKAKVKFLIVILICILFLQAIFPNSYLKVNMVDVGQGDCIFIETPHKKTILVDTGGTEGSDYDVGEKVVVPYLLDRGKIKVDYVFISHMHDDHAEGLLTIIDKLKVGKIIINEQKNITELYKEFLRKANERSIGIIFIDEGDDIIIDDVKFEIILSKEDMQNYNNTSVVMRMMYGDVSMLFTGDAEKELEECAHQNIKSSILKVPHHGSNTSSTDEFLKKVSPQVALIGVGKNNKFGHPKKKIIDKLNSMKVNTYRTDINGEIYMRLYKNGKIVINTHL